LTTSSKASISTSQRAVRSGRCAKKSLGRSTSAWPRSASTAVLRSGVGLGEDRAHQGGDHGLGRTWGPGSAGCDAPLSSDWRRDMGWGGEEASVVGPHAADNAVCELAFVGASGFFLGLAFGAFAGHERLAELVVAGLGDGNDVEDPVDGRLPSRSRRWRSGSWLPSPEEVATGATPHQRAKALSVRKRVGLPISATSSAAPTRPMPTSSLRVDPHRARRSGRRCSSLPMRVSQSCMSVRISTSQVTVSAVCGAAVEVSRPARVRRRAMIDPRAGSWLRRSRGSLVRAPSASLRAR